MNRIPRPADHVMPVTADALGRRFPGWTVTYDPARHAWYAEQRSGTAVHVLAAHEPFELAIRIEAAESEDGPRWVSSASGPDWREPGCQRCGQPAPDGNDLCPACEDAAAVQALAVLRSAAAKREAGQ